MNDKVKELNLNSVLSFVQFIAILVAAVWFAAGLDSRLAMVEMKQDEKLLAFEDVRSKIDENNYLAKNIKETTLEHRYTNADHVVVRDPDGTIVKLSMAGN